MDKLCIIYSSMSFVSYMLILRYDIRNFGCGGVRGPGSPHTVTFINPFAGLAAAFDLYLQTGINVGRSPASIARNRENN